jgi:rhamnulokinase
LFGAIDLGASSGRIMGGIIGDGEFELNEIHRFPNLPVTSNEGLFWDYEGIQREITTGLTLLGEWALQKGMPVASIGVDSWAVDYALLDENELLIAQPRHYRDERNQLGVGLVNRAITPEEQYARNGLQFLPFNSIYQLSANSSQHPEQINRAHHLLMIPDLITHWLTGTIGTERTNASTTGLLNATSHEWDWELIDRLGLPRRIFGKLLDAGTTVGKLLPQHLTHPALIDTVITVVGTHDTASAIAGAPIEDGSAYLSSGTWSLLGVELDEPVLSAQARKQNFTNELGVGNKIRFLKNLSGLWLLQQCMIEFHSKGKHLDVEVLLGEAARISTKARINVNDQEFVSPGDMPGKILTHLMRNGFETTQSPAEIVRIILESLADAYSEALIVLQQITGKSIQRLNVVGGGALNALLCQLTADRTGLPVVAGPVEATAIGNLINQAAALGSGPAGLEGQREVIRFNYPPVLYNPSPQPNK